MSRRLDRRRFLQTASAVGAGLAFGPSLVRGQAEGANDRLRFACVGVGGKGSSDTDHVAGLGDIVGLCDIDSKHLGSKAEKHPKAKTFADFRKMLEELEKSIDAVVVSSPDHTHAPAALMAMRMGKPVYCQKPLAHSAYEARLMREVAAEKKVATQMGNQGTSHPGFRSGIDLLRSGAIGPIKEVHVWTNRPFSYWKQAPDVTSRPAEAPVPESVAWDLFLGPAPKRPYGQGYHPFLWRGWWDFGTGAMGDMACHTANLAFMALKLGLPTHVTSESAAINPETYPAWSTIHYDFPARGDHPAVKLTWYEGARDGKRHLPNAELFQGKKPSDSGSLFIGEKGSIYSPSDYGSEQVVLGVEDPRAKEAKDEEKEKKSGKARSNPDQQHKVEWVNAIRANDPTAPWSNFGYAGTLTEAMLLGNVSVRLGKPISYDAASGTVPNDSEANHLVHPEFRPGWMG